MRNIQQTIKTLSGYCIKALKKQPYRPINYIRYEDKKLKYTNGNFLVECLAPDMDVPKTFVISKSPVNHYALKNTATLNGVQIEPTEDLDYPNFEPIKKEIEGTPTLSIRLNAEFLYQISEIITEGNHHHGVTLDIFSADKVVKVTCDKTDALAILSPMRRA